MQYMLLAYTDPKGFAAMKPDDAQKAMAAYAAFGEALRKDGLLVSSNRLRPTADSTTVRIADGKTRVLNGPYAETKEELGGYFLIDVRDLDAALSWAARCPAASHGVVEVRPVWAM
ncbi:MAG: YciI family protein [Proteobacteria bacterium]|nr:YciI family protein [Pseudomonadota bacterium]